MYRSLQQQFQSLHLLQQGVSNRVLNDTPVVKKLTQQLIMYMRLHRHPPGSDHHVAFDTKQQFHQQAVRHRSVKTPADRSFAAVPGSPTQAMAWQSLFSHQPQIIEHGVDAPKNNQLLIRAHFLAPVL